MRKLFFLLLLAVFLPNWVLAQDRRDDRDGNDRGNGYHQGHGNNHYHQPRQQHAARPAVVHPQHAVVSAQFRSMGVHSYPKPFPQNHLLLTGRANSSIAFPNHGPNGVAIHANLIARTNFSNNPVVRAHMNLVMGGSFRANINIYNTNERLVNHYYWHSYNGFNFCHYYDPWGYHWYGWYLGSNYFWTRWYSNHYWWYDPVYYRWCYWHDGGWWWQDPSTTTIYVYNNGSYVSSNGGGSTAAPAPQSNVKSTDYFSKDSTREVRVLAGGDAFLYDISGANTFKPIYLGSNVTDVKFSNSGNGGSLQILLILKDGTFSTFDGNGSSLSGGNGDNSQAPMNNTAPSMDQNQNPPASAPNNAAPQPPPSGANPPGSPGTNS